MKVVIEGLGSIAQKHITAIKTLNPNTKIFGLRSSKNSTKYNNIKDIYDYSDLDEKPDFILISSPTQYHREGIRKAINLNIPIVIEKPVLHNFEANDINLLKTIQTQNIKTYIACNLRFHPILIFLKNYLEKNNKRINEVNVYCGSFFPDWRPNRDYKQVYSAKNEPGGGIHLELIHELDYTCWLFGLPIQSQRTLSSKSSINIESADYAHYLLEYQNFYATITLNYYRKIIKRGMEILFDDETWSIDLINSTIINDKNEIIFNVDFKIVETYTLQMQHIFDVVRGNAKSLNSIEESLKVLKVCLNE